jgi:hypothetical protein
MRISNLRARVHTQLLEFAWSQWAQMGLSGHATRQDRWAMDPEALLLFTIEVARHDPRLFDEVLDWLALNGEMLILQRLRNLGRRHRGDSDLVDAALAWGASVSPSVRWSISPSRAQSRGNRLRDVFTPDVVGLVQDPDPFFARFGYRRPRAERSHNSVRPNMRLPINFAFRLRLLFGLGSRAEVLRILLSSEEANVDVARIADEAAFAKRNVNETLSALAESGSVEARWSRNERIFSVKKSQWEALLDFEPGEERPRFMPWNHLLPALTAICVWLREADPEWSDYLAASESRSLVETLARDLESSGIAIPDARSFSGASYSVAFERVIEELLASIAATSR